MSDKEFTIELAQVCIGIKPKNERIRRFCSDYIVDDVPAYVIQVTEGDIDEENERAIEYMGWGDMSELELEKLWIYRQIAEIMPSYDVLLIHASAVVVDGNAYLFAGPSGAGKTTQTKIWKKEFQDRMRVINDDKPLIRVGEKEILVCGSPWCGKEKWNNNIKAPLKGVICVNQARENRIEPMRTSDAWEAMMNQVYRSRDAHTMHRVLGLIDRIIESTPVYRLECNRDQEAARIAFETVSRGSEI